MAGKLAHRYAGAIAVPRVPFPFMAGIFPPKFRATCACGWRSATTVATRDDARALGVAHCIAANDEERYDA